MDEYDRKMSAWEEAGSNPDDKPLYPRNVLATIDTSGSMASYNVLAPADALTRIFCN